MLLVRQGHSPPVPERQVLDTISPRAVPWRSAVRRGPGQVGQPVGRVAERGPPAGHGGEGGAVGPAGAPEERAVSPAQVESGCSAPPAPAARASLSSAWVRGCPSVTLYRPAGADSAGRMLDAASVISTVGRKTSGGPSFADYYQCGRRGRVASRSLKRPCPRGARGQGRPGTLLEQAQVAAAGPQLQADAGAEGRPVAKQQHARPAVPLNVAHTGEDPSVPLKDR